MRQVKTGAVLAALVVAVLPAPASQALSGGRGSNCAVPWRVSYAHGRVTGNTAKIFLAVSIKGNRISITWHAKSGYRFCAITLTERRGQVFRSTNPSATYRYTDLTRNHSNGIKTLTATARNGR